MCKTEVEIVVTSVFAFESEKFLEQTEQFQYSMLPLEVHVASFAATRVNLCEAGIVTSVISAVALSLVNFLLHPEQDQYSTFPFVVHDALDSAVFVNE